MTRRLKYYFLLLLLSFSFAETALADPSFNSYPNTTTVLTYSSVANFTGGVSSATLTIQLTGLNNNTVYTLYFRSSSANFFNAGGVLPLSTATFTYLTASNSATGNGKAITIGSTASNTALANTTSNNTGSGVLISFTTGSRQAAGETVTITYRINGIANLFTRGAASPGLNYGDAQLVYDLRQGTTGSSWTNSGNNHKLRITVIDALSFTVNNATTTMVVSTNTQFTSGFTQVANNQFSICSNEPFKLEANAANILLGLYFTPAVYDFTAKTLIPTNCIQLKINNSSTSGWTVSGFTALNGLTKFTLASVIPRSTSTTPYYNIDMAYKLVPPADLMTKKYQIYTVTIVYTATQN